MAYISPPVLYTTAAVLYGVDVPGHMVLGFQSIYKSLDKLPNNTTEEKVAKTASRNCYTLVTTFLAANALLNWQWSTFGGPATIQETAILISGNLHTFYNGFCFLRAGDSVLGCVVMAPPLISLLAFGLQAQR